MTYLIPQQNSAKGSEISYNLIPSFVELLPSDIGQHNVFFLKNGFDLQHSSYNLMEFPYFL